VVVYINPSKISWLLKFLAIQIRFKGSPSVRLSLTAFASVSALGAQTHNPEDSFMHNPKYPARTSTDAGALVPTRLANVIDTFGLTCV